MYGRTNETDPFFNQPYATEINQPLSSQVTQSTVPSTMAGLVADSSSTDMKEFLHMLHDGETTSNVDTSEHIYTHSTHTTRRGNDARTHDIKTYRTNDGCEVVKETKRLGGQTLTTTTIKKGENEIAKTINSLEGKELDNFNTRWRQGEHGGQLLDEYKYGGSGTNESNKPPSSTILDDRINELKDRENALNDKVKRLEGATDI